MDFDVVKTPNIEVTVEFLASITAELDQRYATHLDPLTNFFDLCQEQNWQIYTFADFFN